MSMWVVLITMTYMGTLRTAGDCPAACDCKWKSGKESVLCANRNLTGIPQHLESGTQLLDLSGNNLTAIHEDEFATARLVNLQKVFLSRCSLRTLHGNSFRSLMNLVDLDLSFNVLTSVPYHTFEHIPELMELKLNGNPIGALRNDSFKSVPHLNKLDLSSCKISYIETNAFVGLEHSLEWLKLEKNRIVNLRAAAVTILGNLHGLELAGNPWNCSCNLRSLREWMLRHNIPQSISPVCKSPDRLSGKLWDKLDLDDFACLPRVAALVDDKNGEEGDNITLSCTIRSSPLPLVKWLKKEKVIANLSGIHSGGRHLFTVQVANMASNLTITSVEMSDSGEYVCRAENKAGKAEARINLAIAMKPDSPVWPARIIIATAAVIILFTMAAILLTVCVCCLWKKQNRFHRHSAVSSGIADTYEMNHKTTNYDKIIRCSTNYKTSDDEGRNVECRNGYVGVAESEYGGEGAADIGNGCAWRSSSGGGAGGGGEAVDGEDTNDLHIPRLRDRRSDVSESRGLSSASELLTSTPGLKKHILHKEIYGPNHATLYTSSDSAKNYPDLLETDKNTLPRRGYKPRRTRTGSCGSESMSPLLQGSSDESCDSGTPLSVLDLPDPYPELDKFLKEYRNLQEQLYRMKESCENLKQDNLRFKEEESKFAEPPTISRLMDNAYTKKEEAVFDVYNSASGVEPMYSATKHMLNDRLGNVLQTHSSEKDNNNPESNEKSSDFSGDNFWMTRSKLLDTLSDSAPRSTFYES